MQIRRHIPAANKRKFKKNKNKLTEMENLHFTAELGKQSFSPSPG